MACDALAQRLFVHDLDFHGDIDLLKTRLLIEREIYPATNIDAAISEIDRLEHDIRMMPSFDNTTDGKLNALIDYIYRAGEWNNNQPFQYDFSDPLGTEKPQNSMVSNYINTKLGNCVSMPILLLALGRRIGLDMHLSLAPKHFFIQLTDNGFVYNVEATAGGLKANQSYLSEFLISEQAVKNGIYMVKLDNRQAIGAMYYDLLSHYLNANQIDTAQKVVDKIFELNPNSINAVINQGNIYWHRMDNKIKAAQAQKEPMTDQLRAELDRLVAYNNHWFRRAESLGWREPPKDYDQRYLEMVERVRGDYEVSD